VNKLGSYESGNGLKIGSKGVNLIGESRDGVIISGSLFNTKESGGNRGTDATYTLFIEGDDFYAENITIRNTAGATAGQAVAVLTRGDKIMFNSCNIEGYQDTHYADGGREYVVNSEVKGSVDFVFGSGAVMYDSSIITCRNVSGGYITAPSDVKNYGANAVPIGILMNSCSVIGEDNLSNNSYYLGRPWSTNSFSGFVNCKLGSIIRNKGWNEWNGSENTADFFEYNSMNLDGTPADVTQRVSWSHQLTQPDLEKYSMENYFNKNGDVWNPRPLMTPPSTPTNVYIKDNRVFWDKVDGARGYIVLRNDSLIAGDTLTYYNTSGVEGDYSVKSFNQNGALSSASSIAIIPTDTATSIKSYGDQELSIYVIGDILYVPQNEKVEIYNLMGNLVKTAVRTQELSLSNLKSGVYIVRVVLDNKGSIATRKILK
jgi:hypothetical protein